MYYLGIFMSRFAYSIIFVSEMNRSVAFYRDAIGLPLKFQSPGWSEFNTGGCTLALHKATGAGAMPERGPGNLPAGHSHPGFNVDDLDAFHQKLTSLNVPCLQPPRHEEFGGRLAIYADPDGLPVTIGGS